MELQQQTEQAKQESLQAVLIIYLFRINVYFWKKTSFEM